MFWGMLTNTNSVDWCQNGVLADLSGCQNEVFEGKIAFFCFWLFCVADRETEKIKINAEDGKRPKSL